VNNVVVKPGGVIIAMSILGLVLFLIGARMFGKPTVESQGPPKANAGSAKGVNPSPTATSSTALPLTLETPTADLRNPGYETPFVAPRPYNSTGVVQGAIAEHWYDDSSWAPVKIDYSQEQNNPHSGASCQRIDIHTTPPKNVQFIQTLQLQTGKTYSGGLYVRADHPMKVHLLLRQAAQPCSIYGSTDATADTTWKQITATGKIGQDRITYLMLQADEPGTIWIDDASLESK